MAKKPAKEEVVFLSRQQIITCQDVQSEVVPVPEWAPKGSNKDKCFVKVFGLDGHRRDKYQNEMQNARVKKTINLTGLTTKLVIACVLDPDTKKQLFNESDLAVLQAKSAKPMDRIVKVAQQLSGMGDDDIKEILEDFDLTPKENSGTPSLKK